MPAVQAALDALQCITHRGRQVGLDHLAGALAALMQGGGFLIAAIGPYAMAVLHDWTGGFAAGWYLHLGCVLVTALLYLRFDPRSYPAAMPVAG